MAKISTYPSADVPLQLSDRLIGTEAVRPVPSPTPLATKNFSLGELLQLFSANFPAATLQAVLNAGNTATQNITLTGTISTTLIKPVNIEDTSGSQGLTFQVLSKGTSSINWVNMPVDNLQAVLNAGNTATQNITLVGDITSTNIIPGNIKDGTGVYGTTGQVLSKTLTGIKWVNLPTASTPSLGDVVSVGNVTLQDIYAFTFQTNTGYGLFDDGVLLGDIFQFKNGFNSYIHYGGTSFNNWNLPSNSGTLVLSVNGVYANTAGEITIPAGGVTAVTAISPIISSGGTTPVISTLMATNRLIGRSTAGSGVMEQITIGSGLLLSGGILSSTAVSPLTTKGDLYTFSTVNARLGVGTNGQVLSADSTTATGLRWITFTGGSGITSLNGLTGATQTFNVGTSGTNFNISSSGTVHNFNLPDASATARGVVNTGGQTFIGDKTFVNNIIVNGINVGVGPGNNNTNVVIGKSAGDSLNAGEYNVFLGAQAGVGIDVDGSTVIGNNLDPEANVFSRDLTLSIGKQTTIFKGGARFPQFWSPDTISVNTNSTRKILSVRVSVYSAAFIDYVIYAEDGSLRAGTIKALWTPDGVTRYTEETTDSIGDTHYYTFSVEYDSGVLMNFILTNTSSTDVVYCNYTSRLLLRPNP